MKIAAAQINPTVGDLDGNRKKICAMIEEGRRRGAELIVFPELALCGYPPEDLLVLPAFIEEVEKALLELAKFTKGCHVLVGTIRKNPNQSEKGLCNSAALFIDGALIGFQDKALLPDYDVFSERRYFEPATQTPLWSLCGKRVAITICEDIWQHAGQVGYSHYPKDPVEEFVRQKPDLLINLSSSPYFFDRPQTRIQVGKAVVKTLHCPLLLCNQVGGNDGLLFDGHSFFLDQEGNVRGLARGFEEELLLIDTEHLPQRIPPPSQPLADLFSALVMGVRDYFRKQGFQKGLLGLSGGIDSALVAVIAKEALGKENVQALSLPSRYTPEESKKEARELSKNLGISFLEVPIEEAHSAFLHMLESHFRDKKSGLMEENLQSRIRGLLLMAFSNQMGALLLNTGNKSEMAMGYTTLYGDLCGAIGVLSDVTKRQVYALAHWINRHGEVIPQSTLEKPPSAELRPNQKDSDTLPPYDIIDHVIEGYIEEHLSADQIAKKYTLKLSLVEELIKRIHLNEYKRRQSPLPLRVTKKAFTLGRRFPIVQKWKR